MTEDNRLCTSCDRRHAGVFVHLEAQNGVRCSLGNVVNVVTGGVLQLADDTEGRRVGHIADTWETTRSTINTVSQINQVVRSDRGRSASDTRTSRNNNTGRLGCTSSSSSQCVDGVTDSVTGLLSNGCFNVKTGIHDQLVSKLHDERGLFWSEQDAVKSRVRLRNGRTSCGDRGSAVSRVDRQAKRLTGIAGDDLGSVKHRPNKTREPVNTVKKSNRNGCCCRNKCALFVRERVRPSFARSHSRENVADRLGSGCGRDKRSGRLLSLKATLF